jgi:hypothetical protein
MFLPKTQCSLLSNRSGQSKPRVAVTLFGLTLSCKQEHEICFLTPQIILDYRVEPVHLILLSSSEGPWPPLWSSGQSSWLHIQRSWLDSRRCQIFWEVVGLEQGPLSLVSTIEELLEGKHSDYGLENREYSRRDPSRWPRGTVYPRLRRQAVVIRSV